MRTRLRPLSSSRSQEIMDDLVEFQVRAIAVRGLIGVAAWMA
jgi:hypothetical protein